MLSEQFGYVNFSKAGPFHSTVNSAKTSMKLAVEA